MQVTMLQWFVIQVTMVAMVTIVRNASYYGCYGS